MKGFRLGLWAIMGCSTMAMASWGVSTEIAKPRIEQIQPLSDKERLLRLERQFNHFRSQDMMKQLSLIQKELRNLRGQIDESRHEVSAQKTRQKKFYQDLDTRVDILQANLKKLSAKPAAMPVISHANKDMASTGDMANYQQAFTLLQEKNHDQAAAAFHAYIKRFPKGQYVANAWYWLGSIYLLQEKPALALSALQRVVADYQHSQKVAGSWYKMAEIYKRQGKMAEARQALKTLIEKFPQDKLVKEAKNKLTTWH